MFDLEAIQSAVRNFNLDGWLLYDFRGNNVPARRVLEIDEHEVSSRRYLYFIPATGEPKKLVHRIEAGMLDHLPGDKKSYLRWQEFEEGVGQLIGDVKRVAMEYSPRNANPYIARVDAGTVELVKSYGVEVISSGNLIQLFEATWDNDQWKMHLEAEKQVLAGFNIAFTLIAERVHSRKPVHEIEVQTAIMDHFHRHGLTTSHPPIVAVGSHSGNPHYAPDPETDALIQEGDFVLIDAWAKLDQPRAVYSDLTKVGYVGKEAPTHYTEVFEIVARARDTAIDRVRDAFKTNQPLRGWEVDQAARQVIDDSGYGQYFVHRTGHSIGQEAHGNGANMDNLETHDERMVLRKTCFSIEPGIYLPNFGIRSEVNVFVDASGQAHVTGEPQEKVLPILGNQD